MFLSSEGSVSRSVLSACFLLVLSVTAVSSIHLCCVKFCLLGLGTVETEDKQDTDVCVPICAPCFHF